MDQNKFFWLYRKSNLNACGSGWHLDPAVLTGGGLIGSAGGWRAMRAAYEAGIRLTSDERILGSSSFVEKTLDSAGEDYDRWMRLKASVSRTVGWVQADQALKKMSKTLLISSVAGGQSPPYINYTGINHGRHQSPLSREFLTLS